MRRRRWKWKSRIHILLAGHINDFGQQIFECLHMSDQQGFCCQLSLSAHFLWSHIPGCGHGKGGTAGIVNLVFDSYLENITVGTGLITIVFTKLPYINTAHVIKCPFKRAPVFLTAKQTKASHCLLCTLKWNKFLNILPIYYGQSYSDFKTFDVVRIPDDF